MNNYRKCPQTIFNWYGIKSSINSIISVNNVYFPSFSFSIGKDVFFLFVVVVLFLCYITADKEISE